jgi:hypothetical protein
VGGLTARVGVAAGLKLFVPVAPLDGPPALISLPVVPRVGPRAVGTLTDAYVGGGRVAAQTDDALRAVRSGERVAGGALLFRWRAASTSRPRRIARWGATTLAAFRDRAVLEADNGDTLSRPLWGGASVLVTRDLGRLAFVGSGVTSRLSEASADAAADETLALSPGVRAFASPQLWVGTRPAGPGRPVDSGHWSYAVPPGRVGQLDPLWLGYASGRASLGTLEYTLGALARVAERVYVGRPGVPLEVV